MSCALPEKDFIFYATLMIARNKKSCGCLIRDILYQETLIYGKRMTKSTATEHSSSLSTGPSVGPSTERALDPGSCKLLEYCKALSDPTRLRLVHILGRHELNVNELLYILNMGQSRVSRHLKILTSAGLLTARREGLWVFYSGNAGGRDKEFLNALRPFMDGNPSLEADLRLVGAMLSERGKFTRSFFNSIADDWDRLNKEILGDFDLPGAVISRMPPSRCAVDLGCGTGQLLRGMLSRAENIIGVDGSPRMIELAKRLLAADASRVSLRIGDLEHLPLRDSEADFVTVNMVLHHLPEPFGSLDEIRRVLAPGGRLLVTDFARHDCEEMRREYGDRWLGLDWPQLRGRLVELGFSIMEDSAFAVEKGLTLKLIVARNSRDSVTRHPSPVTHDAGVSHASSAVAG